MSFSTPLPRLCQNIVENPREIASSYNRNGYLCRIGALVSGLALVIIFTSIAALSLGLLPAVPFWATAIACVASGGFIKGIELWGLGSQQFVKANDYQRIIDKLDGDEQAGGLKDWDSQKIQEFLTEQGIDFSLFTPETLEALSKQVQADPYLALLPLVARFKVSEEDAAKLRAVYDSNAAHAADFGHPGEEVLEAMHRFTAMDALEELASTKLNSAILLENLQNPTCEYEFQETEIPRGEEEGRTFRANALFKIEENQKNMLGCLCKKNRQIRAMDYIAERAPLFFFSTLPAGGEMPLGWFRETPSKEIRVTILGGPSIAPIQA